MLLSKSRPYLLPCCRMPGWQGTHASQPFYEGARSFASGRPCGVRASTAVAQQSVASTAQGEPREGAIIDYLRNGKSGLALITGKDGKRNWHATDLRYIVARSNHPPSCPLETATALLPVDDCACGVPDGQAELHPLMVSQTPMQWKNIFPEASRSGVCAAWRRLREEGLGSHFRGS